MMQAGKLASKDVLPKVAEQIRKTISAADIARGRQSPARKLEELKTAWMRFNDALGQAGAYDLLVNGLSLLTKSLRYIGAVIKPATSALKDLFGLITDVFGLLWENKGAVAAGGFLALIFGVKTGIIDLLPSMNKLKLAVLGTSAPWLVWAVVIASLLLLFNSLEVALEGGDSALKRFAESDSVLAPFVKTLLSLAEALKDIVSATIALSNLDVKSAYDAITYSATEGGISKIPFYGKIFSTAAEMSKKNVVGNWFSNTVSGLNGMVPTQTVNYTDNSTINGTNLSPEQLKSIKKDAVMEALDEKHRQAMAIYGRPQ